MYNPEHVARHTLANCVDPQSPYVAQLQRGDRKARVIEHDGDTYVLVLDADGLEVTKFRRKPLSGGGVQGAVAYLERVGYR